MADLEILALMLLVCGGFAATNLDNLVLMVVLLSAQPQNRAATTLGFVAAAITVLCVSMLGAVIGTGLDPGIIGYMGFAPLLIGIYLLIKSSQSRTIDAGTSPGSQASGILATFLLMLGNSGDSVAVFFPLLAESERNSLLWEISAFLLMVLLWAALAWKISEQPALAGRIERVGEKLVPWVMIAAGIYILLDTGTDTYYRSTFAD